MSGCAGRKLEEGGRTLTNVTNETRRGGNFPMGLRRRKSNEHSPSSQKSPPGAGEGPEHTAHTSPQMQIGHATGLQMIRSPTRSDIDAI